MNYFCYQKKSATTLFKLYLLRLTSVLVFFAFVSANIRADSAVTYRNPVIPGDHPDPSIIRVGKDYWATSTTGNWGPEFPLLHSRDLVNWELKGAVFTQPPAWAISDFWAPEISEFKGRYHVYYAARKRGGPLSVAVATADKPGGPYADQGPIVSQADGSIDPAPAIDENGKPYLVWKEDGNSIRKPTVIWAQPLDESGAKLIGEPTELIRNDVDWEGGVVEGPYILRRGGWFYLFYSGNGCCGPGCNYALGVARSHKLLGPWEKNPVNPILAANDTWKCPGHGSIVTDPQGRYWFLYHAYSTGASIFTGRQAMLDQVIFGADDWPTINQAHGPSVEAPLPFAIPQREADINFTDTFSGHELNSGWRWPLQNVPQYQLKHGHLLLTSPSQGTGLTTTFIVRATEVSDYVTTTEIDLKALKPGVAAGLGVFNDFGAAAGVAVRDGKLVAWRRKRLDTHQAVEPLVITGKSVQLRLTVQHGHPFQFTASLDGRNWVPAGEGLDDKQSPMADQSRWVALTVGGVESAEAGFKSFSIQYNIAK